jgi:hypothetical protein
VYKKWNLSIVAARKKWMEVLYRLIYRKDKVRGQELWRDALIKKDKI